MLILPSCLSWEQRRKITLSSVGKMTIQRTIDYEQNHFAYFNEQSHEVRLKV